MSDLPVNPQSPLRQRRNSGLLRFVDWLTHASAFSGTMLLIGSLVLLIVTITIAGWPAIQQFGLKFLITSKWDPAVKIQFGAWPYIYTTLVTSFVALLISVPISIGSAIFLSKLAPKVRIPVPAKFLMRESPTGWILLNPRYFVTVASFLIELLAAIPSIAYGLWGVAVLVPFMQNHIQPFLAETTDLNSIASFLPHWHVGLMLSHMPRIPVSFLWLPVCTAVLSLALQFIPLPKSDGHGASGAVLTIRALGFILGILTVILLFFSLPIAILFADPSSGSNIFTSSLVLAIMVTPIMTAIIRDVLMVVPPELEQGALGLGATWWQAMKLVLGFSKMGIFGAVVLGFARAMGETMAVTMIIGNSRPNTWSLFSPGQTISSLLANQFNNADTDAEKYALFYAALVLLLITMLINGVARAVLLKVTVGVRKK